MTDQFSFVDHWGNIKEEYRGETNVFVSPKSDRQDYDLEEFSLAYLYPELITYFNNGRMWSCKKSVAFCKVNSGRLREMLSATQRGRESFEEVVSLLETNLLNQSCEVAV